MSQTNSCGVLTEEKTVDVIKTQMYVVLEAIPPFSIGLVTIVSFTLLLSLGKINRIVMINILAGTAYSTGGILFLINSFQLSYCGLVNDLIWSPILREISIGFYLVAAMLSLLYIFTRTQTLIPCKDKAIKYIIRLLLLLMILGSFTLAILSTFWGQTWKRTDTDWQIELFNEFRNQILFLISNGLTILFYLSCLFIILLNLRVESRQRNSLTSPVFKKFLKDNKSRILSAITLGIPMVILNLRNEKLDDPLIRALIFFLAAGQWSVNMVDSIVIVLLVRHSQVDVSEPSPVNGKLKDVGTEKDFRDPVTEEK
ncbi:hypothetical protein G9A89_019559 [Geosiphon pyriformis]|nr:hypothetical protein G9A89_019559 [Geosiphon pyriformis]